MPGGNMFAGVDIGTSAMGAERLRMTVAAENLAHAGSTQPLENGLPYARQRVNFQTLIDPTGQRSGRVRADVIDSPRYDVFHDPDHPHADADGMVTESAIDPILELTDLMVASKSYESNVHAVKGLLRMHEQALRLGES
jgi:flagellar basal-body rod protein FlgC